MSRTDCSEIQDLFSRAFDDRLDAREKLFFRRHLGECSGCAAGWARYRDVFLALQTVPMTTTDAPAPFPETARGFGSRAAGPSRVVRAVRAAAVFVLLVGVGALSYDLGRRTDDEVAGPATRSGAAAVAAVDPTEVRFPARSAGRTLNQLVKGAQTFGLLASASAAGADADEHRAAMAAVDGFAELAPLRADARQLREMDEPSLRSFTPVVHAFAGDVLAVLDEHDRLRGQRTLSPEDRLARVRVLLESSRLGEKVRRLSRVASVFDSRAEGAPLTVDTEGSGELRLAASGALFTIGHTDQAGAVLKPLLSRGDDPLRRVARVYALGTGLAFELRDVLPSGAQGLRLPEAWMVESPLIDFEIGTHSPGRLHLELKRLVPENQRGIERVLRLRLRSLDGRIFIEEGEENRSGGILEVPELQEAEVPGAGSPAAPRPRRQI